MKPRALFICGSLNQTTQMHQIAQELPEFEHAFSPYYLDGPLEAFRRARWLEFTVAGEKLRARCLGYLAGHGLTVDERGARGPYELVVTCSDLVVPRNVRRSPLVLVQEGILDPPDAFFPLVRWLPFAPRWLAGTAATGLSRRFHRFCVASDGYRDHFVEIGVPAERICVTGIPNFDDCDRYRRNEFPHRHYVLVCTSDARETFKRDDRVTFVRRCQEIAAGRPLIFKLHPNEDARRATAEIHAVVPGALVYATGSAEEMIANADVFIGQYSSTAFVALALGKEVHSHFDVDELRRLLPIQNRSAARNVARVCRELVACPDLSEDAGRQGVRPLRARPQFSLLRGAR